MAKIGLCVNASGQYPAAAELRELGISGRGLLRTPVQGPLSLLDPLAALCRQERVGLVVMLNNECREVTAQPPRGVVPSGIPGWPGWLYALGKLATEYGDVVTAVELGNELDRFADTPPSFAATLIRRALPILRSAGLKTVATSVAGSDWQRYLAELALACGRDLPDAACLHPYGKTFHGIPQEPDFGPLDQAIGTARQLAGLPIALTEGGVKIGEVGGEAGQAKYVKAWANLVLSMPAELVPFGCYFAWADQVGAPDERGAAAFGLVAEDGRRRPAWNAFQQALGGPVVEPAPQPTPHPIPPAPPVVWAAGPQDEWIGSGLLDELNRRGWTPLRGEKYERLVCREGELVWCGDGARAIAWEAA